MKQSEPTRWNSSLTMFKSIAAVWNEISAIMVERNEVDYLSGITANKLSDVIQFREPFKDASNELEKDTSPSIQRVVFILHNLTKHVEYNIDDDVIITNMKKVGRSALKTKWERRLQPIHYAAVIIHPKAKNSPVITEENKNAGITFIRSMMEKIGPDQVSQKGTQESILE